MRICRAGTLWVTSLFFVKGALAGSCQVVLGYVCKASWASLPWFFVSWFFVYHLSSSARSSVDHRVSWGINNANLLRRGAACSCEVSHGAGLGVCSPQLPGLAASPGLSPAPSPTLEPSAGGSGCVSSIWIWCADFQQETKQAPKEHNFGPNRACLQYEDECGVTVSFTPTSKS